MGNPDREMEAVRNKWESRTKSTIAEMKNSLNGHNNRMELAGERDSELKDRSCLIWKIGSYGQLKVISYIHGIRLSNLNTGAIGVPERNERKKCDKNIWRNTVPNLSHMWTHQFIDPRWSEKAKKNKYNTYHTYIHHDQTD